MGWEGGSQGSLTKLCLFPSGESSVNPSGVSLPLTSWYFMPLMEHSRNCISFSVNVPVLSVNTYSTFCKIKQKTDLELHVFVRRKKKSQLTLCTTHLFCSCKNISAIRYLYLIFKLIRNQSATDKTSAVANFNVKKEVENRRLKKKEATFFLLYLSQFLI